MSEKIFDLKELHKLIRPDADARDKRLFDMRQEQEAADQALEDRAKDVKIGPPPEAQFVYNHAAQATAVAVRGAKFVCQLPKGYGGPGCELAMIPGGRFVLTQPDKSPLLIDPQSGTTRRL